MAILAWSILTIYAVIMSVEEKKAGWAGYFKIFAYAYAGILGSFITIEIMK